MARQAAASLLALLFIWFGSTVASAQAATVDLSVTKAVSKQNPAIGEVITYTVVVTNAATVSATATNVVVTDQLLTAGATYVPGSASATAGSFASVTSATVATGTWTIPSIAPGASATLTFRATVQGRGVWFNIAEVTSVDQNDPDSPTVGNLFEDDYAAVCFAVPILFFEGDEYTVSIPGGFDQIEWYRNDVPISASAVSTSLAVVNNDNSLTIKSAGIYRFMTYKNGCPSSNCCNIELVPVGSLGNFVWEDTNANGRQDTGEPGIAGLLVSLYGADGTTLVASTTTASGGVYSFTGLTSGSYTVKFTTPPGFMPSIVNAPGVSDDLNSDAGTNGLTRVYTIDTSQPESSTARNNSTVDAGYYKPASLGNYVFADNDRNGVQSVGDTPIAGVTVTLLSGTAIVASATTDANGLYSFTGLTPGVPYSVSFATPANYTTTSPLSGTDRTLDSDVTLAGVTAPVTLTSGENNTTVDAGYQLRTAGLGNFVFDDKNANGQQDAGEPGIPNVTVSLLSGTAIVANTTTDANGLYSFTGLTPGVPYSVSFTAPTGYSSTLANTGNDATDSDAVNGLSQVVSLTANEYNTTIDAGYYKPASLGNYVFADNDRNGIQSVGDTPIAGVTVSLLSGTAIVTSTTTDVNGLYSFTGLTPGVPYSVSFATPTNYTATTPTSGTDKTLDSDVLLTGVTASVTLASGEANTTIDAGLLPQVLTAGLGDLVFEDTNANGQQDAGEPGIPNVTVTLLSSGTVVASTTTGANGLYSFTGLTPSVPYSVSFTAPAGYSATLANVGNDATDSDAVNGLSQVVSLTANEYNTSIDAGYYKPASLGNYVFADNDRNGVQSVGDTPLAGVTVTLLSGTTVVGTIVTGATGLYSFTGLTPGVPYSLSFTVPATYTATTPASGTDKTLDSDVLLTGVTGSVTLASGENNTSTDAGFQPQPEPQPQTAALGNLVFEDTNANGQQDTGEPGIPNVTVSLLSGTAVVASTTTDANGLYSFTGLTPGQPYSVSFTAPTGYSATLANTGNDATDSDGNPATGLTGVYTLTANQSNLTVDMGYYRPASLGDKVFADNDGNGIQSVGDTPIASVTVTLLSGTSVVGTTTTDVNGLYSFTGLTPGVPYSVRFTAPTGYTATAPLSGTDRTLDSDVTLTGGTASVTLASGETNTTVDAGYLMPMASIGNFVWADLNGNGIQDAGEPGIAGVRVTLFRNGAPTSQTVLTDASGAYSFTGLTPGSTNTYAVGFSAPTGFTATVPLSGTNSALDSDLLATGQTGSLTLTSGEYYTTLNAGFVPSYDVRVDKQVLSQQGGYLPGQTIRYQLTVRNNSAYPVYNVVVADQMTAGVSFSSGAGLVSSGASSASGVVGSLAAGGTTSLTYTAQISNTFSATSIANVAVVGPFTSTSLVNGYKPSDTNPVNNTATTTVPVGSFAGLGNFVWVDANGNGIQDTDEPGLEGVKATLYINGQPTSQTVLTSSTGFYSFTGLTPGSSTSYAVGFTTPTNFSITTPLSGTDRTHDSDLLATGVTGSVTLASGEFNANVDAGFKPKFDVGVEKVVLGGTNMFMQGDTVTYQLTVRNNSPYPVYNVVVTDQMPTGLLFVSGDGFSAGAGNSVSAVVAGPVAANGGTSSLTVAAKISPQFSNGDLTNIVVVGVFDSEVTLPGDSEPEPPKDTNPTNNTAPAQVSVGPMIVVNVAPAVCNPATNGYVATGTVSFTNIIPGVLTITDRGVPVASLTIAANQTSATFSLTGVSNGPDSRTITATLSGTATLLTSATYAVPVSCTLCQLIALTPSNLIAGVAGTAYSQTLTASGGSAPYTHAVVGGALPTGLSLNPATGVMSGTPTTAGVSAFTVIATDTKFCTGTASYSLTVGAGCPANFNLTASLDASICNGESTTLVASTPVPGAIIRWYLTPYDGQPVASVASNQPYVVNPTTTTVYYAEAVTVAGSNTCVSARKPVVVTVTTVQTPIALGNIRNACPSTTVDLTAIQIENQQSGLSYEWYTSMNRAANTRVTNLTAVGAGKYYLFAKQGRCYSNPTVLTVEIVDCNCQNVAGVDVGPGVSVCYGDVLPLKAELSGPATSVVWSTSGTGTFSSLTSLQTTYIPSKADSARGAVLITVTTNDPDGSGTCQAATSSLIVSINARPGAPVGVACDDTLICQGSSTKLIAFAPGAAKINWYDQNNRLIGTTQSGGKLLVTPSAAGKNVYIAEAVSVENCTSTRSSVTVTVGTCMADLAVEKKIITAGPYRLGQKVTYSITATNKGPITATNVKVSELLPAQLTFVSATPSAEYSAGTGLWTIGTLTVGSNRSLLVEATINAGGNIRNRAIVSGSNNNLAQAVDDTSLVAIDVSDCVVAAPRVVCAISDICKGMSTTLTARNCEGTVKWSDGQTGFEVVVTPTVTTVYTASCVVGTCTSATSNTLAVTVRDPQPPVITASADRVCPGTSVTLTAAGCEGGTIAWSERSQRGSSIVVQPNTRTTYTAQCIMGSCPSRPATKTIDITTDLPKPTVTCSTTIACPGEQVTLTVNNCVGTPVWSSTTLTTGSIVVRPTLGNNSYTVYCQTNGCRSATSNVYSISVVPAATPTVTASADSVCAGAPVSLTATGCNGAVVWNATGQNGNPLTGSVITVRPSASISYYAQCRYRICLSEPSNAVPVTVVNPQTPQISLASGKNVVCSGEKVTLTAEGCDGTVKWYGIDRVGASIDFYPTETKEYYATCKQGSCESDPSLKVRITVTTSGTASAPRIAASTTAVCGSGLVSLTATGCTNGTVLWSDGQTGAVVSVTATPTNTEFYAICKATSGTACGSARSNTIKVQVTEVPKPTVTCSTSIACPGEQVTLTVNNCVGTPMWSTSQTTGSIVVSPTVTTGYTVYCQNGTCRSPLSNTYTIAVVPAAVPTIVASATAVEPGGTISLTATGCNGEVIWNATDLQGNNKGSVLVVRPTGTQTYYAQCRYRICLSEPSNTIVVNAGSAGTGNCLADAGTLVPVNSTICAGTAVVTTLSATPNGGLVKPTGYLVRYVLTKGADLVVQQTSATPTFSVTNAAGDYTIHTLVYNATAGTPNYLDLSVVRPGVTTGNDVVKLIADRNLCADLDVTGAKIRVNHVAPPVVSPNKPFTVCAGSTVTFTATGCEGGVIRWSNGDVGATIRKTMVADLWLMATCTIDGCTSDYSNTADAMLGTPGVPTVAVDRTEICTGEKVTLTATGCAGGQYVWSDNVTIGSSLTAMPTANVSYRVKCKVGVCESAWSPATAIKVGAPAAPTISVVSAGTALVTSTSVCFGTPVTLTAQGCATDSYVTWSNNEVGGSITVTLASSQTITARCCPTSNCKSAPSNSVVITILPKVSEPQVVDRVNTCPMTTVNLASAVTSRISTTGGVFEYYTSPSLSSELKLTNLMVGTGTYYVVEKTTNGCYSLPAMVHVQINGCTEILPCDANNPAKASAGADASICAAKTYQLAGGMSGAGKTAYWTTSGTGSFDNPFLLNATYSASAEDVLAGKVTLTLSVSTNNAACPVATDAMVLTIGGSKAVPTVKVIGSTNLCYGDSVKLEAPAGAGAYLWSNKAKTQTIVVKTSGAYSVQLFDPNGCSSVKSADVVVTVADPAAVPLVSNLRNTCPAVVANLTSALSATTAGSTYEYRIAPAAWSKMIARPDSVGAGTYYVFERNKNGCVSAPAKVVVSIFSCAADTVQTDLAITKVASVTAVKKGEPVTYTIRVTNLGKHTATHIDVRDVLPKGLELVTGSAVSYSVSNGVISKRIDSLKAGKSDSIVFQARLVTKGAVVNTAQITYLDQKDPNLANNKASVTVTDTSAYKPSLIGLAKAVLGTPKVEGDSLIKVSYRFVATNFGDDTLRKVQVTDDLAFFFVPNQVINATVRADAGSTLKPLATFTGTGSNTNLFDSTSYLAPGRSQAFTLDVTVRRAAGDTTRAFRNMAQATAMNSVTVVSDLSTSGGDSDPDEDRNPTNNTGVTSFTLGAQPQGPSIGLALAVMKVEKQADSSYTVTYKATIRNFGNVDLEGVSLTDSLAKTFASPVSYSVLGTSAGAGSSLVVDATYNGSTQPNVLASASKLAAGEQDTVLIVVNVKLNGNNGPFFSTATVTGKAVSTGQTVSDISNNGFDPTPEGAVSTPVRFDLPQGLIGVAKSVGTPVIVSEGVFDIPYMITVKNAGTVPLTNVQIVDNLSETFRNGALIVSNRVPFSQTNLKVDTLYTGQGLLTKMLADSVNTLAVGESKYVAFTVRVDARNADSLTFYNTAIATALTPDKVVVEDQSTTGNNVDPDNDLDPRNNSLLTPIALRTLVVTPNIGVALSVRDTVRQADGTFNVTYQVVVKNYSQTTLTNVAISDTLTKVFNSSTGSNYTVVNAPVSIATGSTLKLNANFDGDANPLLVLGDSSSTLAAGQVDSILVVVNVATNGTTTTFLNTAYATAKAGATTVRDVSTNGLNPDLNGNNNPTDMNERETTPLNLPATSTDLFIPEGFSPNGDGINDLFVIRGTGSATISLDVYNRWGHLVYKNDDYRNDWDGKPNTGIMVGNGAAGVPDGTYYYVIKLSDGRQFVRYMTINR